MEITQGKAGRWFKQTYKVRFDNAEEAADLATYGTVLPFPSIATLRTMSLAVVANTNFPKTVTFSRDQLVDVALNLLSGEFGTSSDHPPDVANRLLIMSDKVLDAVGIIPPNK